MKRRNIQFLGEGAATALIPASSWSVVFDSDVQTKGNSQNTLTADNAVFANFMIDAHAYGGEFGIRNTRLKQSVVSRNLVVLGSHGARRDFQ